MSRDDVREFAQRVMTYMSDLGVMMYAHNPSRPLSALTSSRLRFLAATFSRCIITELGLRPRKKAMAEIRWPLMARRLYYVYISP